MQYIQCNNNIYFINFCIASEFKVAYAEQNITKEAMLNKTGFKQWRFSKRQQGCPLLRNKYLSAQRGGKSWMIYHLWPENCAFWKSFLSLRCLTSQFLIWILSMGFQDKQIHVVTTATTLASLMYASPTWWGFTTAEDRDRTEGLMSRLQWGGYLPSGHPSYEELADEADIRLLRLISSNPSHVLSNFLPNLKWLATIWGLVLLGMSSPWRTLKTLSQEPFTKHYYTNTRWKHSLYFLSLLI